MHSILIVDSIFREETFASVLIGTKGLNITCLFGSKVTGILQLMTGIWISSKKYDIANHLTSDLDCKSQSGVITSKV